MSTRTKVPTVLVCRASVRSSRRLSPSFQRVTLGSPDFAGLADLGFDTRIKLVLPGPGGALPATDAGDWYTAWLAMPDEERSPMRTYTVRDVVRAAEHVHLVVDLVVHDDGRPDHAGPACRWALQAAPGDEVVVVAPHRGAPAAGRERARTPAAAAHTGFSEFDPAGRRELLLVGDETALPAITRIMADLGPGCTGHAFVEVSGEADLVDVSPPPGIELHAVFRGQAAYGRPLAAAVRRHLGLLADPGDPAGVVEPPTTPADAEPWETPRHPATDAGPAPARPAVGRLAGTYAWIAGESWAVRALRRALVSELGMDRTQVAFMGYWREGVSMRG